MLLPSHPPDSVLRLATALSIPLSTLECTGMGLTLIPLPTDMGLIPLVALVDILITPLSTGFLIKVLSIKPQACPSLPLRTSENLTSSLTHVITITNTKRECVTSR